MKKTTLYSNQYISILLKDTDKVKFNFSQGWRLSRCIINSPDEQPEVEMIFNEAKNYILMRQKNPGVNNL